MGSSRQATPMPALPVQSLTATPHHVATMHEGKPLVADGLAYAQASQVYASISS